ncbi:MAG: hypothetical protein KGJ13_02210 [Patescibacteria group bacterium]|nr:hypothetical protein [Patescibacteria group bacterium]
MATNIYISPVNAGSAMLDDGTVCPLPFKTADAPTQTKIEGSAAYTNKLITKNNNYVPDYTDVQYFTSLIP